MILGILVITGTLSYMRGDSIRPPLQVQYSTGRRRESSRDPLQHLCTANLHLYETFSAKYFRNKRMLYLWLNSVTVISVIIWILYGGI